MAILLHIHNAETHSRLSEIGILSHRTFCKLHCILNRKQNCASRKQGPFRRRSIIKAHYSSLCLNSIFFFLFSFRRRRRRRRRCWFLNSLLHTCIFAGSTFFFPRSRRHTHWTHKNQLRPNTFDFFFSQYYFCFPFRFVAAQIVFYQFRIENRKGTSAKGQISTEPRMWNTEPINLFIWNNVFSSVFVSGSRNWRNSCSVTRGNCERIIRIPTMKTTATCRSSSNSSSSSDRSNRRTVAQQVSQPLS